ncbi:hypothetical protein [Streptomyces virginiae]|uniref:hypothetical protein n=1 Tax=Streptomyces virginiae TaxID=1961 RepID=UPI0036F9D173
MTWADGLYDSPEADFSPSNLWPEDRSWILCTDCDLWATKASAPSTWPKHCSVTR